MTDGAGSQTYTYDGVNRLTAVTRGSDSFSYDYDLAGNLTRRTYPDGTVAAYGYGAESRLASVVSGGQTTTYAYDVAGNLTQTTLPASNGHVEERTYDRAGRLVRVRSVKGASTLVDLSYTLDPVGNPIQVVRSGSAPGTTTYTYDVRDRLTEVCFQASCPGASDPFIRWTYDPVGNRLTEARPTGTTSYTYNAADQLTQAGATTYGYDENGNQTQAGIRIFGYDLANRLRLTTSGAQTTTYNYDGDGNRLQAIAGIQLTNYHWDTSHSFPQVAVERDGTGAVLRRHIHGERRISTIRSAAASYYHYDELGSVVNVTSGDGASQWTYSYEPFGTIAFEAQDDPSAAENVLKFTGEMLDPTGSYYLRARQYDPATGRFWRPDPLALSNPSARAAFISTYAYVGAQPTVLVDPGGMTGIAPRDADSAANVAATDNVPAGSGYFRGVVDEPHFSRVEYRLRKRYSYAVKGRWVLLSGYAKTARLKLWLEWKKDDGGWFDDGWKRMGTPTQRVVPHRVTIGAGVRCKKDTVKKIRGVMDVDIIGKHDDSRRDYSIEDDVPCAPDPS